MSELAKGLLNRDGSVRDLTAQARLTAKALIEAGVDPAVLDIIAEYLARWASFLSAEKVTLNHVKDALAHVAPADTFFAAIAPAFARPISKAALAALAVHIVDVCEAMAFIVFTPELPSISARADRSGGAARSVGVAKRLRG